MVKLHLHLLALAVVHLNVYAFINFAWRFLRWSKFIEKAWYWWQSIFSPRWQANLFVSVIIFIDCYFALFFRHMDTVHAFVELLLDKCIDQCIIGPWGLVSNHVFDTWINRSIQMYYFYKRKDNCSMLWAPLVLNTVFFCRPQGRISAAVLGCSRICWRLSLYID